MKDETKQLIEKNYGKIYILGLILIYAAIIILGIWGFFSPMEKMVMKPAVNRQIVNSPH